MARLIDDFMAGLIKLYPPPWIAEDPLISMSVISSTGALLKKELKDSIVYEITNVADHFFAEDKEWYNKEDFPCPRPGFTNFWMEFKRPKKMGSNIKDPIVQERIQKALTNFPARVGVRGVVYDMHDPSVRKLSEGEVGTRYWEYEEDVSAIQKGKKHLKKVTDEIMDAEVLVILNSYIEAFHRLIGPVLIAYIWLRPDGSIIEYTLNMESSPSTGKHPDDAHSAGWENQIFPVLAALSLLNVRNVRVVEVEPPRKLNKAHWSRYGQGLVSFKTIQILPHITRYKNPDEKKKDVGSSRPYQVVPGHYAHYGMVGPGGWMRGKLFGKVTGRFWIPEHSTGNEQAGVIIKDYKVLAEDKVAEEDINERST